MDYLHIFVGTYLLGFFFFQDNLVGTVVVISLLIWIPASCLISWIGKYKHMFYLDNNILTTNIFCVHGEPCTQATWRLEFEADSTVHRA